VLAVRQGRRWIPALRVGGNAPAIVGKRSSDHVRGSFWSGWRARTGRSYSGSDDYLRAEGLLLARAMHR